MMDGIRHNSLVMILQWGKRGYRALRSRGYPVEIRLVSLGLRIRGKRCIHVLHVGKTGGTAVKEALSPIAENEQYRILFHPHRIGLSKIPRRDEVVIFLRDPVARFVSGFNSGKRKGQPKNYSPWTSEEEAFTRFTTPNELAMALSSDDPRTHEKAVKAMWSIRHVGTSFRDWLVSPREIMSRKGHLFIGFTENLDADFEALKAWLGIPSSQAQLPLDPVKAHKTPADFDKHLDPQAIENLRKWYAGDYELLKVANVVHDNVLAQSSANNKKDQRRLWRNGT